MICKGRMSKIESVVKRGLGSRGQYKGSYVDGGNKAASFTVDWDNGDDQLFTLTGNIAELSFSNQFAGSLRFLRLKQDGTGGRTVAWHASVKWPGAAAPTLSAANKTDIFGFLFDGTNYYGFTLGADFS